MNLGSAGAIAGILIVIFATLYIWRTQRPS
jgi:hypothetical protein